MTTKLESARLAYMHAMILSICESLIDAQKSWEQLASVAIIADFRPHSRTTPNFSALRDLLYSAIHHSERLEEHLAERVEDARGESL